MHDADKLPPQQSANFSLNAKTVRRQAFYHTEHLFEAFIQSALQWHNCFPVHLRGKVHSHFITQCTFNLWCLMRSLFFSWWNVENCLLLQPCFLKVPASVSHFPELLFKPSSLYHWFFWDFLAWTSLVRVKNCSLSLIKGQMMVSWEQFNRGAMFPRQIDSFKSFLDHWVSENLKYFNRRKSQIWQKI